jgi:hypothetical protein
MELVELNSPIGYDDDLAESFSSTTSSCGNTLSLYFTYTIRLECDFRDRHAQDNRDCADREPHARHSILR